MYLTSSVRNRRNSRYVATRIRYNEIVMIRYLTVLEMYEKNDLKPVNNNEM